MVHCGCICGTPRGRPNQSFTNRRRVAPARRVIRPQVANAVHPRQYAVRWTPVRPLPNDRGGCAPCCPRARPGILERTCIRSWLRARQRTMRSPRRRRGMVITSTPSPREPCSSLNFRAHPRTGSLTSLVSRPHSGHRSGGGWSAVTNLNPQWGHDSSRTGRSSGAWGSSRSGSWFTMSHVLFSCVVCQYTIHRSRRRGPHP
jgi:hypothetical protein